MKNKISWVTIPFICAILSCSNNQKQTSFTINNAGYFELNGLSVMAYDDFYPEGHQGGITVIQNGDRIVANGDLRLDPTPGQWQPTPRLLNRTIDTADNTILCQLAFPDSSKINKGVNPIIYPDLHLKYSVKTEALGKSVKITVDLENELSDEWAKKTGFNLELFPGSLFGKSYSMDGKPGIFPRQLDSPFYKDQDGNFQAVPLSTGKKITIVPENDLQRLTIESSGNDLQLIDGRAQHNNGWFVVRAGVLPHTAKNAVVLIITPSSDVNWTNPPVIHVSQVGYLPGQKKKAIIETDLNEDNPGKIELVKIDETGNMEIIKTATPLNWGKYLRYNYFTFDFSDVTASGTYFLRYGNSRSTIFLIDETVYSQHAWQPVLEYFLPVQMCHMRVNDRYKVWHGLCHDDDALMAPTNHIHFDGYSQGPSTLTSSKPLQHVPGLNSGGWHDAGDFDLRVESQAGTVYFLSLIYEEFKPDFDMTSIDQKGKIVEMHQPDGMPDIIQQIEHGVLTITGGYKSMGRLYRGIICSTIRQYVMLGDAANMTDNIPLKPSKPDDRWVFTEVNPARELGVSASLAAASKVLKDYNRPLSDECLDIAKQLYEINKDSSGKRIDSEKIRAMAELYLATENEDYLQQIKENPSLFTQQFDRAGWVAGRLKGAVKDNGILDSLKNASEKYIVKLDSMNNSNPFGVPYRPFIWGAGWMIQHLGVEQYYLHKAWPEKFSKDGYINALNFVLGCHPGSNTSSFVSGVGTKSVEVAYGFNRDDWSYIPGGSVSGTALIRPDFPELKVWPYLWQQTEYVLGGGATEYMFLVLAAKSSLDAETPNN